MDRARALPELRMDLNLCSLLSATPPPEHHRDQHNGDGRAVVLVTASTATYEGRDRAGLSPSNWRPTSLLPMGSAGAQW